MAETTPGAARLPLPVPTPGQVVLVTGASRGLGHAVARAFLEAGARVALLARTAAPMRALAGVFPAEQSAVIPCNLQDARSALDAVEQARRALGPFHACIHAAAPVHAQRRLMQVEPEDMAAELRAGLEVCAGLFGAVLPDMLGHRFGRLVAVSSLAASHGASGNALYAAGKAGMEGLVRSLALDHGRHGITANAVAVGFMDGERIRQRTAGQPELLRRYSEATATRRLATPEEVAAVVLFLCSPAGGIITGSVVQATAGSHLNTLW